MKNTEHLEDIKKQYEALHLSEEQLEGMKAAVEQAKKENRMGARKIKSWQKGVAAAVAAFLILPNTSAAIAQTMEQIPLLGGLVGAVTVRSYQYEDEHNKADISIPEITVSGDDALKQSVAEINQEIQQIADAFIQDFEENMETEWGYQNIGITPEVIQTAEGYFTLKLTCYQAAGSGTQWDHYYTIDLTTGERLPLKALFMEDADYITPISENIRLQMTERMKADENVMYWLDEETEEWNFKQISEETAFYINENGNIVISFNEGDVAPMYMGVVTFEIPAAVVSDLRK